MKFTDFSEIIQNGKDRFGSFPALKLLDISGRMRTVSYEELADLVLARKKELEEAPIRAAGLYGPADINWVVDFFAAPMAGKRLVLLDPSLPKETTQALIEEYEIDTVLPSDSGFRTAERGEGPIEAAGCVLVFTSGTTHANKAVVLSQKALAFSAWNGQQMLACGPGDVVAALLPMNHVFGLVCTLLWPLSNGASVGLGRGMRYYVQDPREYQATILVVVPTLLNYLYGMEGINSQCHTVLVGAAPCGENVLKAIKAMRKRVSFGYGLSETASGLAISVDADDPFAFDLCPDTKVRLAEDGEVLVQTTCMMEGYWKRPEETAEVLRDGWLHTGDLGSLDEKGRLHLAGRKNDVLVLSSGEKIFCPEAERELTDLIGGEAALVVMYDTLTLVAAENADERAVKHAMDEFNSRQPISKRIMNYRIIEGKLPRTATGKLRRWKVEEIL